MKLKNLLFLPFLLVLLAACGDDDEKEEENIYKKYAGRWYVLNISHDIDAGTEAKNAIASLLTAPAVKSGTYLKLEYTGDKEAYKAEYNDIIKGVLYSGDAKIIGDSIIFDNEGPRFYILDDELIVTKIDYTSHYIADYPYLKKAIQRVFVTKD